MLSHFLILNLVSSSLQLSGLSKRSDERAAAAAVAASVADEVAASSAAAALTLQSRRARGLEKSFPLFQIYARVMAGEFNHITLSCVLLFFTCLSVFAVFASKTHFSCILFLFFAPHLARRRRRVDGGLASFN
jgi:hypothetical protein